MAISFKTIRNSGLALMLSIVLLLGLVPSMILTGISLPNENMSRKLHEIRSAIAVERLLREANSLFAALAKNDSENIGPVAAKVDASIIASQNLLKMIPEKDKNERKLVKDFENAGKLFKVAVFAYQEEKIYDPAGATALEMELAATESVEKAHKTLAALINNIQEDINLERRAITNKISEGQNLAIAGLFCSVVCGLAVSVLMSRALSYPIRQLLEGTRKIADGDLEHRININTKDEIGQLASSFNEMSSRLDANERKLREANIELSINEHHLKSVLSAITDPIYIINADDYSVQLLNSAAEKMADRRGGADLKCYQISHKRNSPCSSEKHPCPIRKVKETKKPVVMEHVHRDENGAARTVELHAFPIFDETGKVARIVESHIDITARRKMEADLRLTQFAVDHSADAIFLVDSNGGFKHANASACKSLGYEEKELLSMTISDIDAECTKETLRNRWELLKERGSMAFRRNYRKKNGVIFPVEVAASHLNYENSEYNYLFVRDITMRKVAEDALLRAEKEKATILNSISELVIYINSDRKILWANQSAIETFKKGPDELKNSSLCESICQRKGLCHCAQNNRDCPLKNISLSSKTEETEKVTDDGRIWSLKCYPVLCVGDEARAVIIAKDVTKQKEAESELLRVYTAVEEAMEAIIITDLEGRAAYVNRAFSDMLGYSREDLKKETIHSIYADNEEKDSLQQQQSEDAKGFWQWKTHLKKTDGTAIPALIRTTPIPDQNDLPVEMLFIITDLTQHEREEKERRQLELQLSQAQKLESIGQLAAGIAHEINTPTQFVGDNTNFLRDSFEGITKALDACSKLLDAGKSGAAPQELFVEASNIFEEEDVDYLKEEIPEAIEQSLGGIKRISDIVLAMKEFSHPKADEKKATDIHKAIENTLTVSRNEWKYVADAKTDFTEDSPIVECYPGELNQVFLNMFVNAAHTIADANKVRNASKGLITIKTERSGGFFKISVSDTGMGIPEDVRPRIFDMFFTTKDVGKGTGQGLSLAYDAIVNKHGGRLSFDTTEEKGTTFHIELPLKDK